MSFKRYPHLEKYGNEKVEDINYFGVCHVFPKIDGANASIWLEKDNHPDLGEMDKRLICGSRNRKIPAQLSNNDIWNCLTEESQTGALKNDNHGFARWVAQKEQYDKYMKFLSDYPDLILYGEWLCRVKKADGSFFTHTINYYREDTWNKFYVFDIFDKYTGKYLEYEKYSVLLDKYDIEYLPCLKVVANAHFDDFLQIAKSQKYLLPTEEARLSEGIVIKNYKWAEARKEDKVTWAKIVNSEFKDKNIKSFETSKTEYNESYAQRFVNIKCTDAFIEKEFTKIANEFDGDLPKAKIPYLFHMITRNLLEEELIDFIVKNKYPNINTKEIPKLVEQRIKEVKADYFGR